MEPVQTKHIGRAMAILISVVKGHSPQSAGHMEQLSSSSQMSSPQTEHKEKEPTSILEEREAQ